MADDKYVCTLSDQALKTAKEELNENPNDRLSSVQKLREWVEQQLHLTCRTGICCELLLDSLS